MPPAVCRIAYVIKVCSSQNRTGKAFYSFRYVKQFFTEYETVALLLVESRAVCESKKLRALTISFTLIVSLWTSRFLICKHSPPFHLFGEAEPPVASTHLFAHRELAADTVKLQVLLVKVNSIFLKQLQTEKPCQHSKLRDTFEKPYSETCDPWDAS